MARKILLPIDLNIADGDQGTLEAALHILDEGGTLHVVTVVPDYGFPVISEQLDRTRETSMIETVRVALAKWVADHVPEGVEARTQVLSGTIYDQIIRTADRIGVDMIVIGAHRPGLGDYLIGSNAARVVRHAKQSVHVVRRPHGRSGR